MDSGLLDLERLLKLRVAIARFGEMDLAKWWNTKGQLGRLGESALRRGFPRTHHFAQARSVMAVASERCREIFDAPDSVTLWRLPAEIEDELEVQWEGWLDDAPSWAPFFTAVQQLSGTDLTQELQKLELVDEHDVASARSLRTSSEGRAVPISKPFVAADASISLLALGFARGKTSALAVPYMRQKQS